MEKTVSSLTVMFEDPFWIAIYERTCNGKYEVCKITFGAEPKDYEVYEYMLRNFSTLRFSPAVESASVETKHINPKKQQRDIHKQLQNIGIGTKAQQALKLQQEQGKVERKAISHEQRDAEKERRFALRQQKIKEKRKGH